MESHLKLIAIPCLDFFVRRQNLVSMDYGESNKDRVGKFILLAVNKGFDTHASLSDLTGLSTLVLDRTLLPLLMEGRLMVNEGGRFHLGAASNASQLLMQSRVERYRIQLTTGNISALEKETRFSQDSLDPNFGTHARAIPSVFSHEEARRLLEHYLGQRQDLNDWVIVNSQSNQQLLELEMNSNEINAIPPKALAALVLQGCGRMKIVQKNEPPKEQLALSEVLLSLLAPVKNLLEAAPSPSTPQSIDVCFKGEYSAGTKNEKEFVVITCLDQPLPSLQPWLKEWTRRVAHVKVKKWPDAMVGFEGGLIRLGDQVWVIRESCRKVFDNWYFEDLEVCVFKTPEAQILVPEIDDEPPMDMEKFKRKLVEQQQKKNKELATTSLFPLEMKSDLAPIALKREVESAVDCFYDKSLSKARELGEETVVLKDSEVSASPQPRSESSVAEPNIHLPLKAFFLLFDSDAMGPFHDKIPPSGKLMMPNGSPLRFELEDSKKLIPWIHSAMAGAESCDLVVWWRQTSYYLERYLKGARILCLQELAMLAFPLETSFQPDNLAESLNLEAGRPWSELTAPLLEKLDENSEIRNLLSDLGLQREWPWAEHLSLSLPDPARVPSVTPEAQIYHFSPLDHISVRPFEGTTAEDFLGASGWMSQCRESFKHRPTQAVMVESLLKCMVNGSCHSQEAGTGSGKTLMYLSASALHARKYPQTKVIIAANTLHLQQQIVDEVRDKLLPYFPELKVSILKGRKNYLDLSKLNQRLAGLHKMESSGKGRSEIEGRLGLAILALWAKATPWGTVDTLSDDIRAAFRRQGHFIDGFDHLVDNMTGPHGDIRKPCFYQQAIQAAIDSHIVIANHALLCSWPAQKSFSQQHIILDEAHHFEQAVTSHLSKEFGLNDFQKIKQWIKKLTEKADRKGRASESSQNSSGSLQHLEGHIHNIDQEWVSGHRIHFENNEWAQGRDISKMTDRKYMDWWKFLAPAVEKLAYFLEEATGVAESLGYMPDEEESLLPGLMAAKIRGTLVDNQGYVRTLEVSAKGFGWTIRKEPIHVGDHLHANVYPQWASLALISATMEVKGRTFVADRIGAKTFPWKGGFLRDVQASPFDYKHQMKIWLATLNSPVGLQGEERERALIEMGALISQAAVVNQGRSLVLFSANLRMELFHKLNEIKLFRKNKVLLLSQNQSGKREHLLSLFKRRSGDMMVLSGGRSFWEGIDLPGAMLNTVFIEGYPGNHPSPLLDCRNEEYKDYASNLLNLFFRQGLGRLIRTEHDTGRIVVIGINYQVSRDLQELFPGVEVQNMSPANLIKQLREEMT